MEFSGVDLNSIIMKIFNEDSSQTNNDKDIKIEPTEFLSSMFNEKTASSPTNTTTTTSISGTNKKQPYYFIVFNNPRWSQILRKQRQTTEQQLIENGNNRSSSISMKTKEEEDDEKPTLDEVFIEQLRKLIYDYMERTTRPFPFRYFIDLTTNP